MHACQIELLDSHLQAIFQIYGKDWSGKIDLFELRDALYGIGYAIPTSVLQLLFFFRNKIDLLFKTTKEDQQ